MAIDGIKACLAHWAARQAKHKVPLQFHHYAGPQGEICAAEKNVAADKNVADDEGDLSSDGADEEEYRRPRRSRNEGRPVDHEVPSPDVQEEHDEEQDPGDHDKDDEEVESDEADESDQDGEEDEPRGEADQSDEDEEELEPRGPSRRKLARRGQSSGGSGQSSRSEPRSERFTRSMSPSEMQPELAAVFYSSTRVGMQEVNSANSSAIAHPLGLPLPSGAGTKRKASRQEDQATPRKKSKGSTLLAKSVHKGKRKEAPREPVRSALSSKKSKGAESAVPGPRPSSKPALNAAGAPNLISSAVRKSAGQPSAEGASKAGKSTARSSRAGKAVVQRPVAKPRMICEVVIQNKNPALGRDRRKPQAVQDHVLTRQAARDEQAKGQVKAAAGAAMAPRPKPKPRHIPHEERAPRTRRY